MATSNGRKTSAKSRGQSGIGLAAAVLAALIGLVWGADALQTNNDSPPADAIVVDGSFSDESSTGADVADSDLSQFSDLPSIAPTDLPFEALDTLTLIDSGGPFPFDRDGLTFQNREGLLPDRSGDHYQEFTVITPGSDDRGARRIVAGSDGELYYTSDHYSSFAEIVGWQS